jgi:hypothetical protein
VVQAQRLLGDPDYLLRVITRDLPSFRQVYDDRLSELPASSASAPRSFMRSVVESRPLSL